MTDIEKEIIYPERPPKQPSKQILRDGMDRLDKELGLWWTHDPAIYKDPVSRNYYIYCTGAVCQKSSDLIHWEMVGKVVEAPPQESIDWVGENDIWAPDIVKVGKEYRLYCSNSSWGVRQSCIFLAVADKPEGPFEPRGCVLKTTDEMPVNAIDANIITDHKTGLQYMVYGSFWGGCYVLQLDVETGLAAEAGVGTCLARRPEWMSGGIEGPYMIYQPELDYYYLFVSYGSLKTDYNIRVGRSKSITGPFLDYNGKNLTDLSDEDNTYGYLAMAGYRWNEGTAYMAPGHNSVLQDGDDWYLVCHIRELNFMQEPEPSTMQVRRMYWSLNGWPMVSAEEYAGEVLQDISQECLIGNYEKIQMIPQLPQGISSAVPMKLGPEGYYECCSIQGNWNFDGKQILTISYGTHTEKCKVSAVWDHEFHRPTLSFTGITETGISIWGKQVQ